MLLRQRLPCVRWAAGSLPPRARGALQCRVGRAPAALRACSSQSATARPVEITVEQVADSSGAEDGKDEEEADVGIRPREIVEYLDRYIVGQADAKRAVAIAMRNRWRRQRVASPLREEIMPKNILMIGPTGVGKTEVARRLSKLANAPFVKVEATKFTEVGFVGKDVDQIIRDLVEAGLSMAKAKAMEKIKDKVAAKVEERVLDCLVGATNIQHNREAFRKLLRMGHLDDRLIEIEVPERKPSANVDPGGGNSFPMNEIILRFDKMMAGRQKLEKREMALKDAVPLLTEIESEKLVSEDEIKRQARSREIARGASRARDARAPRGGAPVASAPGRSARPRAQALWSVEQEGIVFIDEIDKICSRGEYRGSADASSEGVQRDLLPLLEGSVVSTKHGNVNTDHILFIASGAFHYCKPSDLLAELQVARPPPPRARVRAWPRRRPAVVVGAGPYADPRRAQAAHRAGHVHDTHRAREQPRQAAVRAHVHRGRAGARTSRPRPASAARGPLRPSTPPPPQLEITDDAKWRMAKLASEINRDVENIGARRLHTIMERLTEDLSFSATERAGEKIEFDAETVQNTVGELAKKADLKRFVL